VILTLEVSAPQGVKPGLLRRQQFGEEGGTIGRDAKNSWVLADSEVSSRHARITYRNRAFYIEDNKSTNGISLNSLDNRLVPSRPYALKSGDRIFIRPYEIYVSIADDTGLPAPRPLVGSSVDADPFSGDDPFAQRLPVPGPGSDEIDGQELNPLKLLPPQKALPRRKMPLAQDLEKASLLEQHYHPPGIRPVVPEQSDPLSIPIDYNPLEPDEPKVASVPPLEVQRPEPTAPEEPHEAGRFAPPAPPFDRARKRTSEVASDIGDSADAANPTLADVLAGAGFEGVAVTPELASCFGQILRVVVSGLMDVLHARQQIKEEFRLRLTHFRPADNNPLKFSANADDALHNLLVKRNAAYLGPVEAFTDAFEDLKHHQLAMLEGMRMAFEAMLAEFDPDRLQAQFDQQLSKASLISKPAKLRYWDLYRDFCKAMIKDKEANFLKLFGEEFASAYDEQFRRLKADNRARTDRADKPPIPEK
jgi:type VI secretion system FHA domain protein